MTKPRSLDRLYPSPAGRKAGDEAVDRLPPNTTTLSEAIDAWDQAYYDVTGYSPFFRKDSDADE